MNRKEQEGKKIEDSSQTNEYTAKQITVLAGLEPVRRRPGMYIGGTGPEGLHHLVWEVVDNGIDEAMAGFCNEITVTLLPNNRVAVLDNGRGIPIDIHKQTGKSALETVLCTLHAGAKFGEGGYKVSGGLHGVGVSVVNALSFWMMALVKRENQIYSQEYSRGKAKTEVKKIKIESLPEDSQKIAQPFNQYPNGTLIIFEPDPMVFEKRDFNWQTIVDHLRQQAYLTKGVKIRVRDLRLEKKKSYCFYFEGGISSYVKHLNKNKHLFNDPPVYIEKESDGFYTEVALAYVDDFNVHEFSFANNIHTTDGGMHLTGFRTALTRAINDYAKKSEFLKNGEALTGEDVREGLTTVVSVKLKEPQFEGQTKSKLGNPEARTIVEAVTYEGLNTYLEEHPQEARRMIEKCALSLRARLAAKAARETVIRKGVLEGMTLPGKLADCSEKDPAKSELYIVEGDSAGGCFSGETKIALADGRDLTFKELIQENKQGKRNYCYTIKADGLIGIEQIKNPRITKRNVSVIKLILDNDKEIICTPQHEFMLRNGSYLQAKDLKTSMSLMPLRRKLSTIEGRITIEGYEMVFNLQTHKWIFTHLLADQYNLSNKIYSQQNGFHKHHLDFNKLNNNPSNLIRLSKEEHIELHAAQVKRTLHRKDVWEKLRQLKSTTEFQEKMSRRMKEPATREILSKNAKKQWGDINYKNYMKKKFLEFYYSNSAYRERNNKLLNETQKKYWLQEENRKKQSKQVREYFQAHPEKREELALLAKQQWKNPQLLTWRRQKTKGQWTNDFRKRRKRAYNETYFTETIKFLKNIYEKYGSVEEYESLRTRKRNNNLLKLSTFYERFFGGNRKTAAEAIKNYNHKIKKIIKLSKKIDVYDIEVPITHNFALACGVFVHNSAKQGRDRAFQAILPLRGKILNVERARLDRMLTSEEIKNLIIALGCGIGEEMEIDKIRYHRIIIMTDADVDGSHIRTLLLTFFYRHFTEIIRQGYLYIAQPPLYAISSGKEKVYAYSEEEKNGIVRGLPSISYSIQRYKGLGEMNPTQLWETTMDPAKRTLLKVTIEEAGRADEVFSMLMGDEVPPRKKFIQTHAKSVKNLDI